jgi:hypothetical protein
LAYGTGARSVLLGPLPRIFPAQLGLFVELCSCAVEDEGDALGRRDHVEELVVPISDLVLTVDRKPVAVDLRQNLCERRGPYGLPGSGVAPFHFEGKRGTGSVDSRSTFDRSTYLA